VGVWNKSEVSLRVVEGQGNGTVSESVCENDAEKTAM
jgi:hypothetical protein